MYEVFSSSVYYKSIKIMRSLWWPSICLGSENHAFAFIHKVNFDQKCVNPIAIQLKRSYKNISMKKSNNIIIEKVSELKTQLHISKSASY